MRTPLETSPPAPVSTLLASSTSPARESQVSWSGASCGPERAPCSPSARGGVARRHSYSRSQASGSSTRGPALASLLVSFRGGGQFLSQRICGLTQQGNFIATQIVGLVLAVYRLQIDASCGGCVQIDHSRPSSLALTSAAV